MECSSFEHNPCCLQVNKEQNFGTGRKEPNAYRLDRPLLIRFPFGPNPYGNCRNGSINLHLALGMPWHRVKFCNSRMSGVASI
jgi:hypothetical protein